MKYSGQQPGGNSSFSIGMDGAPDDRFGPPKGGPPKPASSSPWGTDADVPASTGGMGTGMGGGPPVGGAVKDVKSTTEMINESAGGPGSFTSVKYSGQPPGGKSSGPLW